MKKIAILLIILAGYAVWSKAYSYNTEKAVTHVTEHALSRSHNCCAWYVMRAMQAGGCPIPIAPAYAYSTLLPFYGYEEVQTTHYQKGDIVVFPHVKGHKWGHIAMWNGHQWMSDFKQKGIIVNKAYRKVDYKIFRKK